MATLLIEQSVTDPGAWRAAFDGFTELRRRGGVRTERVRHPFDDANYVVVDLDFDTADAAQAFLDVLTTTVWETRELSPPLAGAPRTMILVDDANAEPATRAAAPDAAEPAELASPRAHEP
jgi:hypothetical protein